MQAEYITRKVYKFSLGRERALTLTLWGNVSRRVVLLPNTLYKNGLLPMARDLPTVFSQHDYSNLDCFDRL